MVANMKAGVDYPSWTILFPTGRHIYYEGDDPEGFVREIKEKFNFDPSADSHWGVRICEDFDCEIFTSYSFFCPSEYLDAIYGNDDYPMGS